MDLSPKSRSKTPVVFSNFESEMIQSENHTGIEESYTRITRSATTKTLKSSDIESVNNHDSEVKSKPIKSKNSKTEHNKLIKTQYASSDLSENESLPTFEQNLNNQFIEETRRSVSRSSGSVSALDFYRAAGEYWNKFPKTDYTYSPHSKDRREIAPGIVAMPNMSRKSLHRYEEYIRTHNEDDFNNVRQRTSYSNNHYEYSSAKLAIRKESIFKRTLNVFTSIFVTIYTWISTAFYYIYYPQKSLLIWFGKKIHKATTQLMLWDTWLLLSSSRKKKLTSLLALCLIPLIIFGGWWFLSGLQSTLFGFFNTISTVPISYPNDIQLSHVETPTSNEIPPELTSKQLQQISQLIQKHIETKNTYNVDDIVAKVLQEPELRLAVNNYNKLAVKLDENANHQDVIVIENLHEEINKMRLDLDNMEKNYKDQVSALLTQLRLENTQSNTLLTHELKRCCRRSFIQMESYITKLLKDLLGAPQHLTNQKDISTWLHSTFIAKQDLEDHLSNLTEHLKGNYNNLIENNGKIIMDKVFEKISSEMNSKINLLKSGKELKIDSITDERIKQIVLDALAIYDADKTGLVDYALESAGGQVLSTRCTESYQLRTAAITVLGIDIWHPVKSPRVVLTPSIAPGDCWPFQNFPGFLIIKLAEPIRVEAFTMEHISKLLVPNGKIDSAPKMFSVYGLRQEGDEDSVLLGTFEYDYNGTPLQYFIADPHDIVFEAVELQVHSNHGNLKYTCLYRFRVHGKLSTEPT